MKIFYGKRMGENIQKSRDSDTRAIKELVVLALTEFNKWHGVEAVAELVKLEDPSIIVELSGPFCRTCGFYDYFDDLKLEIEKVLGKPLETAKVDSGGAEHYLVTYKMKT